MYIYRVVLSYARKPNTYNEILLIMLMNYELIVFPSFSLFIFKVKRLGANPNFVYSSK